MSDAGPDFRLARHRPGRRRDLEDTFVRVATKYLDAAVVLLRGRMAQTVCGKFRLGLLAVSGSHRIGFECDGEDLSRSSSKVGPMNSSSGTP